MTQSFLDESDDDADWGGLEAALDLQARPRARISFMLCRWRSCHAVLYVQLPAQPAPTADQTTVHVAHVGEADSMPPTGAVEDTMASHQLALPHGSPARQCGGHALLHESQGPVLASAPLAANTAVAALAGPGIDEQLRFRDTQVR